MHKVFVIAVALLLSCNSLRADVDTARINSLISYIYKSASYCKTDYVNDSIDVLSNLYPSYVSNNKYILSKAGLFFCVKKVNDGYDIIDSLIAIPYGKLDLEIRVLAFYQKGRQLRKERKNEESLRILDSCNRIAQLIENKKYAGLALYQKGRIYEDQRDYVNAIQSYNESVDFLYTSNIRFKGELYKSLGIVYRKMALYEEAIKAYNKALNFYFNKGYNYGIASVYNSMGILSTATDHFVKAKVYFKKALFYNANIEENRSIEINVSNNLGVLYNQVEKYDSALLVLNRAFDLAKIQQNKKEASKSINNLAIAYKGKKNYNKSINYYHRALRLKKITGTKSGYDVNYLGIANTYARLNRFDSAKYYFSRSSSYIDRSSVTKLRYTYYEYYSNYFARKKNFELSFLYLDSAHQIQANLVKKNYARIISNYELLSKTREEDFEKQKLENALLKEKTARDIEEAKNTNYRNGLLAAIAIIILISWFAFTLSKNKRKIHKSNERLTIANEKLEQSIDENKSLIGIVAHDLKTPFAQISGLLGLIETEDKETQTFLNTANKVCDDGGRLVRNLVLAHESESINVNQADIRLTEVFNSLRAKYLGKLSVKSITLNIIGDEKIIIYTDKDILIRILDNFLSNAIKFSKANTSITLGNRKSNDGTVSVFVKDQGPGISKDEKPKLFKKYSLISNKPTNGESSSGLGLYITKVLSEKINAEVGVVSEKGQGSEFFIHFK
ncbi:MAG: tetratricopeptide repeat-containing sensor histidine kinase [Bacteroidia bacterium]